MLAQAVDFQAEADELHTLLAGLEEADWQRATLFKGWTVNDVLQHLHSSDLMAAASLAGPESFTKFRAEIKRLRDSGMNGVQETRHRLANLTGRLLLEHWRSGVADLCSHLTAMSPDTRLKWAGPDMGVRMFTTARQMETWAHGQAIYDLMGIARQPTDRLRNIAEIGVRTFGWTFANRGKPVPSPAPYVRLTGPSGAVWEWNDSLAASSVQGNALDFCQVVTQVRNVADTGLRVIGEAGHSWMSLAQCFAGPPEDPPARGTRFTAEP